MSLPSSAGRRALAAAAWLVVVAATAQDTPTARSDAQAAIELAQRESADAQRRYAEALRECDKDVFVNPCRERARQERDRQLRAIREKEVAARDTLRRLDAEERAQARARRPAEQEGAPKARTGNAPGGEERPAAGKAALPSAAAGAAADPQQKDAAAARRRDEAASRKAESEKRAAEQAAERERRAAEQAGRAAQAPAEIERYEQRQRDAQARAAEKKRIAEENRQRREKRAAERGAAQKPPEAATPK